MKIKLGHVTNSSSVSFVGYGICLDTMGDILNNLSEDLVKYLYEKYSTNKYCGPDYASFEEFKKDPSEYYEDYAALEDLCNKYDLEYRSSDWTVYIGMTLDSMKDDETKTQMIERCELALKELGLNEEPYWIDEAWRDG